jgi:hypothetical protein
MNRIIQNLRFFFLGLVILSIGPTLYGQAWEFVKEKDGIKIYTRKENGKELKSYKGVADMKFPASRVFELIEDVNHTEWWDKNLSGISVLQYKRFHSAKYHLVYDLPWPVTDRDLFVEVKIQIDSASGERKVISFPLVVKAPQAKDMIRITDYHQTWTITPEGNERSHVVLEGYVDPAGSIPDWIVNMILVDSPLKVIQNIRDELGKLK